MLAVLIYVHAVFARGPIDCLQHIQKDWPHDGILRVEIIQNAAENYTLDDSYRKEYRGKQLRDVLGIIYDVEERPDDVLEASLGDDQVHRSDFGGNSIEIIANSTPEPGGTANWTFDDLIPDKSSAYESLSEFDLLARVGER